MDLFQIMGPFHPNDQMYSLQIVQSSSPIPLRSVKPAMSLPTPKLPFPWLFFFTCVFLSTIKFIGFFFQLINFSVFKISISTLSSVMPIFSCSRTSCHFLLKTTNQLMPVCATPEYAAITRPWWTYSKSHPQIKWTLPALEAIDCQHLLMSPSPLHAQVLTGLILS